MLRFFDFDYTLCVHTMIVKEYMAGADYFKECLTELTKQKDLYRGSRPLACMQWYARKCHEQGDKLFCITHEIFNLRDKFKQDFIKQYYPPMQYLTVDTPEHKIDMIRAIAEKENVRLTKCELVDDKIVTLNLAIASGIRGTHVTEIVQQYQDSLDGKSDNK